MRSSAGNLIVTLALAACALEHGNQPPERSGGAGVGAGADSTAASPHAPARDSALGALHAVFDSLRETVAPGVTRLTLRMMVPAEMPKAQQRAAMVAVADAVRRRDPSLAALRVLALLPPPPGHGERQGGVDLVPLAYLEWVPPGGWDSLSARTARLAHSTEVLFVQDLPAHPRVPEDSGGGGRGGGGKPDR